MITPSSTCSISYNELECLFNKHLEKAIENWEKEKKTFIENPFNKENTIAGNHMPNAYFNIWLDIPRNMVTSVDLNKLLMSCENAGWGCSARWVENDRTGDEQLYFIVNKI